MYLFHSTFIQGDSLVLTDQEATHCRKVLRRRVGDDIHVIDGRGGFYKCSITAADKKKVTAFINSQEKAEQLNRLTLAFGIIKNTTRLEWMIEKITEIGVHTIQPIICQRSEKKYIKSERLLKIIRGACKQSKQYHFPKLKEPINLEELVNTDQNTKRYIAHYVKGQDNIWEVPFDSSLPTSFLIGPEGDFTSDEVDQALKGDFTPVNLGRSRLRAETAAVVACAHLNT